MKSALAALLFFGVALHAAPLTIPKKSFSLSRQFIVYCDDLDLRLAVTTFADETKNSVLRLLAQPDKWTVPIIVNVHRQETNAPRRAPSQVALFEIEDGFKVELDLELGADPRDIQLRQQITRAVLLELAYRDRPQAITSGTPYFDPPAWLVEGIVQIIQNREDNADITVFQSLIRGEKLLPLQTFLTQKFDRLDSTSRQLYRFYAMNLVQLIIDLPDGREALAALLREATAGEDFAAALAKRVPALAEGGNSAEKWWALGVARLAAADRYKGLTMEETERRLIPLLSIRLASGNEEGAKAFALDDFKSFEKNPQSRAALRQCASALAALRANAHPLFRPIVSEYQQIATTLARGKTSRIPQRLEAAAKYRDFVLHRIDQIADYMNWFEATKMSTRSDAFDDYLKTAKQADAESAPRRDDNISRYLDEMERQYQ